MRFVPPSPDRTPYPFHTPRKRDDFICFALAHPATVTTLMAINLFSRPRKLRACLHRLVTEGRIQHLGTIQWGRGRPEHVYCRWRPGPAQLLQEVQLTEVLLRLDAGDVRRGPFISDQMVRPDAEVVINGLLYYLELDRSPQEAQSLTQRMAAYASCEHPSLWLCATHKRAEALRRQAATLPAPALITTLEDAYRGSHRDIWRDCGGRIVPLPRES